MVCANDTHQLKLSRLPAQNTSEICNHHSLARNTLQATEFIYNTLIPAFPPSNRYTEHTELFQYTTVHCRAEREKESGIITREFL